MPKLGMGPIRREQICRAAAAVISSRGFDGTTMRMVAEEAGVSTGMLNHYFANRMEMLEETLLFVSQRQQARDRDRQPSGQGQRTRDRDWQPPGQGQRARGRDCQLPGQGGPTRGPGRTLRLRRRVIARRRWPERPG